MIFNREGSIECAGRLLRLRKGTKEDSVIDMLRNILRREDVDHIYQHSIPNKRIDIYLPTLRMIIEAKARGKLSLQKHKRQVDEYAIILAEGERHLPSLYEQPATPFTGVLTDGRIWYAWEYDGETGNCIKPLLGEHGVCPNDGQHLLTVWRGLCAKEVFGKRGISGDIEERFRPWLDTLKDIYQDIRSGETRKHTNTKMRLWLDMLRTSGMAPDSASSREHLFVVHTFLVVLARSVIHAVTNPIHSPNTRNVIGDGFITWLWDMTQGGQWAEDFVEYVYKWDWTRWRGDVLRPLYGAFVDERERKEFGEYYTPDWLAEMMVKEVLDEEWCEASITAALRADADPAALNGVGVLDPACGSGTFLFFAADRIMNSNAMGSKGLTPPKKSRVVARLVNGIDVHPVAAEMARATLTRALKCDPGEVLRIFEGDSLLVREHKDPLFMPRENEVLVESPLSERFLLPLSFVDRQNFPESIQRIVDTALHGHECPSDILLPPVSEEEREAILVAHKKLKQIIANEGDSVWKWYITNMTGPYLLSRRKVDRIVANPPWVSMAGIQDETRKNMLINFTQNRLDIWSGGKRASGFDIAQLFVKRCRELYLADVKNDPAAWLVKLTALKSFGWQRFREEYQKELLEQSLDLKAVNPFLGGEAQECCVLFECRVASVLPSTNEYGVGEARLLDKKKRPHPSMKWEDVSNLVDFIPSPSPFPSCQSDYDVSLFCQGATITPTVLTIVGQVLSEGRETSTIVTTRSTHKPWKTVPAQKGIFPKTWIRNALKSEGLLPFRVESGLERAIIPLHPSGVHTLSKPEQECTEWGNFERIYREFRGRGQSTPKTLIERITHMGAIKKQLKKRNMGEQQLLQVVYPASGNIMRAARMYPDMTIIDSSLYWFIADSTDEAAYIVGVLNASVLTNAFAEARSGSRTFHKHPWRKIPIPKYNYQDDRHEGIVRLTMKAEREVESIFPLEKNGGGAKSVIPTY